MTVVAGPATTPQEWYLFNTLVARKNVNNLTLLKMVGDYEGLIKESDVCVATAGYHTSVMLLKHRKKAVVIPFEGYGTMTFHEQPARTVMLKEMIGAKILSIKDLTAKILAATVRKAAACKKARGHIPEEWFMDGKVLDKALIKLFGQ
jgi:predicted glycosyltransferase